MSASKPARIRSDAHKLGDRCRERFMIKSWCLRRSDSATRFYERTQTLDVSAHGALMALGGLVAPRQMLLVQNIASGEQQECRVVYVDKDLMGPTKIAVEFTRPATSFWRIAYPPPIGMPSTRFQVGYGTKNLATLHYCCCELPRSGAIASAMRNTAASTSRATRQ